MLHLSQEEKRRMVQLSQQGVPLKRIAEQVRKEFQRENLSYNTVYRVIQEGDLDEELDEITSKELDEAIKTKTHKSRWRTYDKKVNDALKFMYSAEEITKLFTDALDQYEWTTTLQDVDGHYSYNAIVFVGDLHYGRSTKKLEENWSKMIKYLIDKDYDYITLCLMWDLIESPRVTGMHDAQVTEMELLGIQQALWCVDMINAGIEKLINDGMWLKILWLNWNHVRMSKSRDWDPERIVWSMMYEIIKRTFPNTEVKYSKDWIINETVGKYNLILAHWDNGFNSKSDAQILHALGKVGKHNVIASGHRHTSQMTQGNGYTRLLVPSLNAASEYEKQKFISKSIPWFAILSIENDGYTDLQFIGV